MSRVSKSNKPTANAMRIQAEENRKMLENIKPLKLPSNNINKIKNIFKKKKKKEKKEYFIKDPFKNEIASLTPPKRGPNPQGLKKGDLLNIGCPHRENGVQGSDIKGVKPIQVKGKKFIGVL